MPVRAVIDTNIIVSALLSRQGAPHLLLQALYADQFRLVLSASIQAEYQRVLARPVFAQRFGLTETDVAALFRFLARRATMITPTITPPVSVRDPHDVPFLAAALTGQAEYVVTGDDDLLSLANDQQLSPLQIVTARTFLTILESKSE